ncbi:acyl carrier protein [Streptomyces sp. F63]|uniref:acyl carrier protein n=1 Tax=Streptomyces sp. F63 TaxID=2824887 RepID=UPI001B38A01C|nr:acyl carrier protein [Streptomyces sp. F63]MBQ0984629.1 acyl carrier protein [Streptomyces sp. F63]
MTEEDYASALIKFIGEEFLPEDERTKLNDVSPLMESGVLDSLRVALLLTYIRDELGLYVSPAKIDFDHFKDIRTIAGMLHELSLDPDAQKERT